jgi:hypothetical protein
MWVCWTHRVDRARSAGAMAIRLAASGLGDSEAVANSFDISMILRQFFLKNEIHAILPASTLPPRISTLAKTPLEKFLRRGAAGDGGAQAAHCRAADEGRLVARRRSPPPIAAEPRAPFAPRPAAEKAERERFRPASP